MDDVVAFKSSGDPSSYVGFDTQDPANDSHFTWRGNGALALFPAEWYVGLIAPNRDWVVTWYGDTPVAADAVDLIAKSPNPPKEEIDAALAAIQADPVLRDNAQGIRRVHLYGETKQPR